MHAADPGEADLLARARRGSLLAFEEIVKRYERRVYGIALRIVRRHEVADDVAQEAFMRAHQALSTFDLDRPFGPWICRIAANLAINHVRSPEARETALPEGQAETPAPGPRGPRPRPGAGSARGPGARPPGSARGAARGLRAAHLRGAFVPRDRGCPRDLDRDRDEPALAGARASARGPLTVPRPRVAAGGGRLGMGPHVTERLSAFMDGELGARERAEVDLHLRGCPSCARASGRAARGGQRRARAAAARPGRLFRGLPRDAP